MFSVSRYVPGSYESQNSGDDESEKDFHGPSRAHGSTTACNAHESSEVESTVPFKNYKRYSDVELGALKPRRQLGTDKKKKKKNKGKSSLVNLSPRTLTTGTASLDRASGVLKSRVSGSSHEMKEYKSRKRSHDDSCGRKSKVVADGREVDKIVEPSLLLAPVNMHIMTDDDDTPDGNIISYLAL